METIKSKDRNRIKMFINILSILAIIATAFSVTGTAFAQEPNPRMIAFPENDAVEAWEWPEGESIYLTINNAPGKEWEGVAAVTTWGDPRTYVRFEFNGQYDLVPGDIVTLTDNSTEIHHTVQNLDVTALNATTDTISGTADPGAVVQVWPHGFDSTATVETTAEGGNWVADFAGLFDLVKGTSGRSQILDENRNATAVDWTVPNPRLIAFPESETIESWGWPDGAKVYLTIDHALDFMREQTAVVTPGLGPEPYVMFNFQDGYDLIPGDMVTLTDNNTELNYLVRGLDVTALDAEANIVSGTADTGALVQVFPYEVDQSEAIEVTANDGTWIANLTSIFDLVGGTSGRSQILDINGNATAVDWTVPNPYFDVRANDDSIGTWNWDLGATLTVSIDDPATSDYPDYTDSEKVLGPPPDDSRNYLGFNTAPFDIQPGFIVTISDGDFIKTHTVTDLAFSAIDVDENTVTGLAAPNSRVNIWACGLSGCSNRHIDAGSSNSWTIDFDVLGDEGNERTEFDIVPGTWIDSQQPDEDGDTTMYGVNVPNPYFTVRANDDSIGTWNWDLGATLTVTIDDPATPDNPDYDTFGKVEGPPPDDSRNFLGFNTAPSFDIQPGFVVTISDGDLIKTHTVTDLAFSAIDVEENTVTGFAAPNSRVDIWACGPSGCSNRHVDAGSSSSWTIDFDVLGDEGNEQTPFDIVPGTWIDSQQSDEDGDPTMFGISVPNPNIEAHPNSQWFAARGWPIDTPISVTIDDPSIGEGVDYEDTSVMEQNGYNPGDPNDIIGFFDWPDIGLQPGFIITMTGPLMGSNVTKTLIIPELQMTSYDLENDTVSGIAISEQPIAGVCQFRRSCALHFISADGSGNWTADYKNPEEGDTADIRQGTNGWVYELDADGDQTWYVWSLPFSRDEFNEPLADGWYWVNENPSKWNLTENPGFLRIYTADTGTGGENLLLRPVSNGDLMIKTHVIFEPDIDYQIAGLVIYQDESNFLQFGRAFCDIPEQCAGNGIYFDLIIGGDWTGTNFATPIDNPSEVYLRLERRGESITAFYSYDGDTWFILGTHSIPADFSINAVGLTSSQDFYTPDSDNPADFDFFELSEGGGFLPEGYHDYDQGDVPSGACNAGGWARDPDDRG